MKKTLLYAKKKKWNKTKAKNKLDKLFSATVRTISVCEMQGLDKIRCSSVLQCAHIIGRANLFLRWDDRNAICLCSGHHVFYTYHPEAWRDMMSKEPFKKDYTWLLAHRNEKITFNKTYYEEKLKELL